MPIRLTRHLTSHLTTRLRLSLATIAAAALGVGLLALTPLVSASAAALPATSAASLSACPFWDPGVTPPVRSVSPWVPPLQTAAAVNFTSRLAAPVITGSLSGSQVNLTVSRVSGAVAYRIWRDGVAVAWISDYGQSALTAVDTSPCQGAYYTAVALTDNSADDASMGQMSPPYWLGSNGVVAPGAGSTPVGTTIPMLVTSYNDGGQTASGYNSQLGVCAVDPRVVPWGTYFTVPGYGTCFAGDIGTWIQNDTVDLWLPGSQAEGWGVQDRTITIIADPYSSSTPPTTAPPTTTPPTTAPPTTQPPTTPPTTTPPTHTTSPTATATPTSPSGTCSAAWSASVSYTPGEEVSYGGDNYTATYYSTDAIPGAATSWAVWSSDGACTG
jgi:3D (Asp-Asp-Asp) domain-containing protein